VKGSNHFAVRGHPICHAEPVEALRRIQHGISWFDRTMLDCEGVLYQYTIRGGPMIRSDPSAGRPAEQVLRNDLRGEVVRRILHSACGTRD